MIPIRLRLKNFGPFGETEIDFRQIPGDIIAISGRNGEGKTFLLESLFAAKYGYLPSRKKTLPAYCTGDAEIDDEFELNGDTYRAHVIIDAPRDTSEFYFYKNSTPVVKGQIRQLKKEVPKLIGDPDIVLSSAFACQKRTGSFLSLSKIDRKRLFVEMIGCANDQKLADGARKHVGFVDLELAGKRSLLQQVKVQAEAAVPDVSADEQAILFREGEVKSWRSELEGFQSRLAVARENVGGRPGIVETLEAKRKKVDALKAEATDAATRIQNNQRLLDDAPAIAAAEERVRELRDGISRLEERIRQDRQTHRTTKDEQEKIDDAVRELTHKVELAGRDVKEAERKLASAQEESDIAFGAEPVPCNAQEPYDACKFLKRAVRSRDVMPDLKAAHEKASAREAALRAEMTRAPRPDFKLVAALQQSIDELESEKRTMGTQIAPYEKIAQRRPYLESAGARIEELKHKLDSAEKQLAETVAEIVGLEKQLKSTDEFASFISEGEARVAIIREEIKAVEIALGELRQRVAHNRAIAQAVAAARQSLPELEQEAAKLEEDRRQWVLLDLAFGPTGTQSLEIDAAGPTVSTLANDLLYNCFGPRFSIRFITQRLKSDGEGYKDEFDLVVNDSEKNRVLDVDDLSGGQGALISEAVGLGIALYNKQKTGSGWDTLFRDEVTGFLDDVWAPYYIPMLRRARDMGGFSKVLFICHQSRVQDLADARLHVQDGKVTIHA